MATILDEAEGQYFLERFDDGLYKTLLNPTRDFVKSVFTNMGGKILKEKIKIFVVKYQIQQTVVYLDA